MPRLVHRKPSYRKHVSGQAVVTIRGVDHYLGRHGSAESKIKYRRLLAERDLSCVPSAAVVILGAVPVDGGRSDGSRLLNHRTLGPETFGAGALRRKSPTAVLTTSGPEGVRENQAILRDRSMIASPKQCSTCGFFRTHGGNLRTTPRTAGPKAGFPQISGPIQPSRGDGTELAVISSTGTIPSTA